MERNGINCVTRLSYTYTYTDLNLSIETVLDTVTFDIIRMQMTSLFNPDGVSTLFASL